jgi:hypothetical protein
MLAKKIKDTLVNGRERRVSRLVVDTVHDSFLHPTVGVSFPILPVLHLDLDAFRRWTAWCESRLQQMYSRRSPKAWAEEASEFVENLSNELVKLSRC